eukprot:c5127_g1_i1.p1 GENE.c5127_g1_i1~~c5127_g1_i1.p1  ORF type:complete len:458 (+),score=82.85 c5127_g1_i1:56-1375(+)
MSVRVLFWFPILAACSFIKHESNKTEQQQLFFLTILLGLWCGNNIKTRMLIVASVVGYCLLTNPLAFDNTMETRDESENANGKSQTEVENCAQISSDWTFDSLQAVGKCHLDHILVHLQGSPHYSSLEKAFIILKCLIISELVWAVLRFLLFVFRGPNKVDWTPAAPAPPSCSSKIPLKDYHEIGRQQTYQAMLRLADTIDAGRYPSQRIQPKYPINADLVRKQAETLFDARQVKALQSGTGGFAHPSQVYENVLRGHLLLWVFACSWLVTSAAIQSIVVPESLRPIVPPASGLFCSWVCQYFPLPTSPLSLVRLLLTTSSIAMGWAVRTFCDTPKQNTCQVIVFVFCLVCSAVIAQYNEPALQMTCFAMLGYLIRIGVPNTEAIVMTITLVVALIWNSRDASRALGLLFLVMMVLEGSETFSESFSFCSFCFWELVFV